MSWSINLIGTAENLASALTAQSEKFDGQTKIEFDSALPHLVALVKENFNPDGSPTPVINLTASGHGYAIDGQQKQRYFSLSIQPSYATIVGPPEEKGE